VTTPSPLWYYPYLAVTTYHPEDERGADTLMFQMNTSWEHQTALQTSILANHVGTLPWGWCLLFCPVMSNYCFSDERSIWLNYFIYLFTYCAAKCFVLFTSNLFEHSSCSSTAEELSPAFALDLHGVWEVRRSCFCHSVRSINNTWRYEKVGVRFISYQ